MSKFDEINDALDIEVSNTPEDNSLNKKNESLDVNDQIQKDYEYTRGNLYSLNWKKVKVGSQMEF